MIREREKKILVPTSVYTRPGQENSEKNTKNIKKPHSIREREKKILVPTSVYTRPGQENSEKNTKNIKKPHSGIISSQNGM